MVKVVGELGSGKRAVQSSFHETTPFLTEDILTSQISLADPSYSGVHNLSERFCLNSNFSEEEINVLIRGETSDKLRFIKPLGVRVNRSQSRMNLAIVELQRWSVNEIVLQSQSCSDS